MGENPAAPRDAEFRALVLEREAQMGGQRRGTRQKIAREFGIHETHFCRLMSGKARVGVVAWQRAVAAMGKVDPLQPSASVEFAVMQGFAALDAKTRARVLAWAAALDGGA